MTKRKIILTGSAPYLPKWWEENILKLDGYTIYSINTSVLITADRCDVWLRSEDFYHIHENIKQELVKYDRILYPYAECVHTGEPFMYWKGGSTGTMLFNAIQCVINEAFWKDDVESLGIIGCDLIYHTNQTNHFYAGGTNDPMRLGEPWLRFNLGLFKRIYEELMHIEIYNLSPSEQTLLPFIRKTL